MYKYICTCLGIVFARPGVKSGMSRSLIGCSKISSIPSPLLWDCATHSFRFAELVLLALFCFTAGCICGSVLTAQFLSPKLRAVLSRLIVRWGLSTTINICQSSRRRPRRVGAGWAHSATSHRVFWSSSSVPAYSEQIGWSGGFQRRGPH